MVKYRPNEKNKKRNDAKKNEQMFVERLCLPADTRRVLVTENDIFSSGADNYWLQYHRLVEQPNDQEKERLRPSVFHFKPAFQQELFDNLVKRQKKIIADSGWESQWFQVSFEWRLALGLGDASVYETSITLHPLYGYPYLPAQAIKGVCLSYMIFEYFDGEEKKAEQSQAFRFLFGDQDEQGSVIFTDSIPVQIPKIKEDIINVHYKMYYQQQKWPVDYDTPSLVSFPVVEKPRFQFGVLLKENVTFTEEPFRDETATQVLKKLVSGAFSEHGIGAKTAVNYGYGIAQSIEGW